MIHYLFINSQLKYDWINRIFLFSGEKLFIFFLFRYIDEEEEKTILLMTNPVLKKKINPEHYPNVIQLFDCLADCCLFSLWTLKLNIFYQAIRPNGC